MHADGTRTEDLIGRLAADLRPVRALRYNRLVLTWLAAAAGLIALAVAWHGFRPDFAQRIALTSERINLLAGIATGALAALAAARLAEPGRSAKWSLLPLPAVAAWIAGMGYGCLADIARMGPAALTMGTSWSCLGFIVGLGVPLLGGLLVLLRHGAWLRPGPVAGMAGLAAAALCSVGLSLFHHLDAALMILVWHGGAVALVSAAGALAGRAALPRLAPA